MLTTFFLTATAAITGTDGLTYFLFPLTCFERFRRLAEILSNLATADVAPFRGDGRCGVGWEGPNGEPEGACDPRFIDTDST